MLDKIQFLLSLQIIGFCIFGGATLLLRAGDNRAKRILGGGMFLWAFLAAIRLSVNLSYLQTFFLIYQSGCFWWTGLPDLSFVGR